MCIYKHISPTLGLRLCFQFSELTDQTNLHGFDIVMEILQTNKDKPTRMGFEPTRAEHNGLAVHRLNDSATSSFMDPPYHKQTISENIDK